MGESKRASERAQKQGHEQRGKGRQKRVDRSRVRGISPPSDPTLPFGVPTEQSREFFGLFSNYKAASQLGGGGGEQGMHAVPPLFFDCVRGPRGEEKDKEQKGEGEEGHGHGKTTGLITAAPASLRFLLLPSRAEQGHRKETNLRQKQVNEFKTGAGVFVLALVRSGFLCVLVSFFVLFCFVCFPLSG